MILRSLILEFLFSFSAFSYFFHSFRFGTVSNDESSAVRGWNYFTKNTDKDIQHYCNLQNGLTDCFEKNGGSFIKISEHHDNYYYSSNIWKFSATTMCDSSVAQGVICKR